MNKNTNKAKRGVTTEDLQSIGKHASAVLRIAPPVTDEDRWLQNAIAAAYIDPNAELIKPPVCLEVVQNGEAFEVGTLGDITVIKGKAKSRKTWFLSAMVASMLGGSEAMGTLRGTLPIDKRTILYFDTEQSHYHAQKVVRRILALAGNDTAINFLPYGLRPHSPEKRLQIIQHLIYNTPNVGAIIIDGVKDITYDINDATEATQRVTDLMRWTEENQYTLDHSHSRE